MGLFDDLFGGKDTTTSNSVTAQNNTTTGQQAQTSTTTANQTTNQSQNQQTQSNTSSGTTQQQSNTGVQASSTAGSNVVSSLDANTISLLQSILNPAANVAAGAVGNNTNSDALKKISSDLYAKASGGNKADVNAAVAASTAKAKLDYETGEGSQVNQVAQAIGSSGNTYSQLIKNKGLNDLNTQIAQIVASGALQADQLNSADLNSSADAIVKASGVGAQDATAALNPVLQIISLLKGATTVGQTSGTQTGTSSDVSSGSSNTTSQTLEQQLSAVISQLTGQTSGTSDTAQSGTLSQVQNTTGNQQTKTSKGIIGDILSIF